MDKKMAETVENICTVIGAALMLYPLVNAAATEIAPQLEKLSSGDFQKHLPLLTDGNNKKEETPQYGDIKKEEKDHDRDYGHEEIEELKRKLAEYEQKGDSVD